MRFLILILFFVPHALFSKEIGCIQGKIRYVDVLDKKMRNEKYCFDSRQKKIFSSGKCKKDCSANLSFSIDKTKPEFSGEFGSIGFKICRSARGIPQIIEFWDEEKWIKTARCIFEDTSFVDIETLLINIRQK